MSICTITSIQESLLGKPITRYLPFLDNIIKIEVWQSTYTATTTGMCGKWMDFSKWSSGHDVAICKDPYYKKTVCVGTGQFMSEAPSGRLSYQNAIGKMPQCPQCLSEVAETVFEYLKEVTSVDNQLERNQSSDL